MNEASEVTNKETVNVFSAVGFVASDKGNAVWRARKKELLNRIEKEM